MEDLKGSHVIEEKKFRLPNQPVRFQKREIRRLVVKRIISENASSYENTTKLTCSHPVDPQIQQQAPTASTN